MYGLDPITSRVLRIVINSKRNAGAKCPEDFKKVWIKEAALKEILKKLADEGKIQHNLIISNIRSHLQNNQR
jgi:hypothetical protein